MNSPDGRFFHFSQKSLLTPSPGAFRTSSCAQDAVECGHVLYDKTFIQNFDSKFFIVKDHFPHVHENRTSKFEVQIWMNKFIWMNMFITEEWPVSGGTQQSGQSGTLYAP